MAKRPAADLDRLALDLYAAALDGVGLERPLAKIAAALGAEMSLGQRILMVDGVPVSGGAFAVQNVDPGALEDYQRGWIAHDPWLKFLPRLPEGVVNHASLLPTEEVLRGTYWNEFLARRAPTLHGLSLLVQQPDDLGSGLIARARR